MLGDNALPVFLIVGVAATLAIGSTFTPVISRGSVTPATSKEVANQRQEFAYCRSNLDDVNCACFAGVAGHILSQENPAFRGTVSSNRSELARSQATQSC